MGDKDEMWRQTEIRFQHSPLLLFGAVQSTLWRRSTERV